MPPELCDLILEIEVAGLYGHYSRLAVAMVLFVGRKVIQSKFNHILHGTSSYAVCIWNGSCNLHMAQQYID